jgi:hypothetical protein
MTPYLTPAAALLLAALALETSAPKLVQVTGGGPVIQVLPGPFRFADSAAPLVAKLPREQRAMMQKMAREGPFSDKVAQVSGKFTGSFIDGGKTGDSVAATASFSSQDGARWEVKIDRVAQKDLSPTEPTFGGVATEIAYHGPTGIHTPLVPAVRSVVSFWGMSRVIRNGQLVAEAGPTHVMFTSDTRGDDFAYQCWICTDKPVRQLHLMLMPPEGKPYPVPGGILHVMWEESDYKVSSGNA